MLTLTEQQLADLVSKKVAEVMAEKAKAKQTKQSREQSRAMQSACSNGYGT